MSSRNSCGNVDDVGEGYDSNEGDGDGNDNDCDKVDNNNMEINGSELVKQFNCWEAEPSIHKESCHYVKNEGNPATIKESIPRILSKSRELYQKDEISNPVHFRIGKQPYQVMVGF